MTTIQKARLRREQMGMSQAQLGAKIGEATSRIGKWETGTGEPGPTQLWRISLALGVSLEWLCNPDADPNEPMRSVVEAEPAPDYDMELILTLVGELGPREARRRLLGLAPEQAPGPTGQDESPKARKPVSVRRS